MIGVDTNVLIRALTLDDPEQAPRAVALLRRAEAASEPVYVNVVVLCELAWTLRGPAYGYGRDEIADAVEALTATGAFRIQHRDQVRRALDDYRRGDGDFADHLIGSLNGDAGCTSTATFDRKLHGHHGFRDLDRE